MNIKEKLQNLDIINLKRLKSRIKSDIRKSDDMSIKESLKNYMSEVNDMIMIKEDGDGGSAGVAVANQGNVSGMGNVSSSQPSAVPGAASTGDGTIGSGDLGMPLGTYTKKGITGDQYTKFKHKPGSKGKDKKDKKPKVLSDVADFLKKHKSGSSKKVMDFDGFVKDNINDIG